MNKNYQRGRSLLDKGAYTRAVGAFAKARSDDPDNGYYAAFHTWASYVALRDEGFGASGVEWFDGAADHAREHLSAAVTVLPNFDMGYVFLGEIALDEGQLDEAVVQAQCALDINPDNEVALSLLRRARLRMSESPPTIGRRISSWFTRLAKNSPPPANDDRIVIRRVH